MSIKSFNSKVQQIFIDTSLTQRMTIQDWQQLNELAQASLAKDDERMLRRIMHSVRRGWIQILS